MAFNDSIRYVDVEKQAGKRNLHIDAIPVLGMAREMGTPLYAYSLKRARANYARLKCAFDDFDAHIHYSAKANANLHILRALVQAGAGVDAVSGGEIYRALRAGAKAQDIVYAGVGKTADEISYAIGQGVGWFNVENVDELRLLNDTARGLGQQAVQVALRLNPDVTANTHPYIATGHGGAKFGLTAETIRELLLQQHHYPRLHINGLHVHIGSQLGDTDATIEAISKAVELIKPYDHMRTLNIGGGFPAAYDDDDTLPDYEAFAAALKPYLDGYTVLLEPGRSIIADAGILLTQVLYVKQQAGQHIAIVDASMTDLIRPALYQAKHQIVPVNQTDAGQAMQTYQIVGPVCESADVLGRDVTLPTLKAGDVLAVLTAGAYGMVMASQYNARPRAAEVVVSDDGASWQVARRRETWADLVRHELDS